MKKLSFIALLAMSLAGCGTMGGAVGGAGEDLKRAGDWIRTR